MTTEHTPEPAPRCPKHLEEPTHHPCGPCADARETWQEWQRIERERLADLSKAYQRQILLERRDAIASCSLCDGNGYVRGAICLHDPEAAERAARGAQACREALTP